MSIDGGGGPKRINTKVGNDDQVLPSNSKDKTHTKQQSVPNRVNIPENLTNTNINSTNILERKSEVKSENNNLLVSETAQHKIATSKLNHAKSKQLLFNSLPTLLRTAEGKEKLNTNFPIKINFVLTITNPKSQEKVTNRFQLIPYNSKLPQLPQADKERLFPKLIKTLQSYQEENKKEAKALEQEVLELEKKVSVLRQQHHIIEAANKHKSITIPLALKTKKPSKPTEFEAQVINSEQVIQATEDTPHLAKSFIKKPIDESVIYDRQASLLNATESSSSSSSSPITSTEDEQQLETKKEQVFINAQLNILHNLFNQIKAASNTTIPPDTQENLQKEYRNVTNQNISDLIKQHRENPNLFKTLEDSARTHLNQLIKNQPNAHNIDITDLSNTNRPINIAKEFTNIYENEHSDIIENCENEERSSKNIFNYVNSTYNSWVNIRNATISTIDTSQMSNDQILTTLQNHFFTKNGEQLIVKDELIDHELANTYLAEEKKSSGLDSINIFEQKVNTTIAKMLCETPPCVLSSQKVGGTFDRLNTSLAIQSGSHIKHNIWPGVFVRAGGNILSKGIAQGYNPSPNTSPKAIKANTKPPESEPAEAKHFVTHGHLRNNSIPSVDKVFNNINIPNIQQDSSWEQFTESILPCFTAANFQPDILKKVLDTEETDILKAKELYNLIEESQNNPQGELYKALSKEEKKTINNLTDTEIKTIAQIAAQNSIDKATRYSTKRCLHSLTKHDDIIKQWDDKASHFAITQYKNSATDIKSLIARQVLYNPLYSLSNKTTLSEEQQLKEQEVSKLKQELNQTHAQLNIAKHSESHSPSKISGFTTKITSLEKKIENINQQVSLGSSINNAETTKSESESILKLQLQKEKEFRATSDEIKELSEELHSVLLEYKDGSFHDTTSSSQDPIKTKIAEIKFNKWKLQNQNIETRKEISALALKRSALGGKALRRNNDKISDLSKKNRADNIGALLSTIETTEGEELKDAYIQKHKEAELKQMQTDLLHDVLIIQKLTKGFKDKLFDHIKSHITDTNTLSDLKVLSSDFPHKIKQMTEDFIFNNPSILSKMSQEMLLEKNDHTNTSEKNNHAEVFIKALTDFHSKCIMNIPELQLYVPQPGEKIDQSKEKILFCNRTGDTVDYTTWPGLYFINEKNEKTILSNSTVSSRI